MKETAKALLFFLSDRVVLFFTKVPFFNFLFIKTMKHIAWSGKGTNYLAENGIMVYPIHFYSKIQPGFHLKHYQM